MMTLGLLLFCGCRTVQEARKVQQDPSVQLPGEITVRAESAGLVAGRCYSLSELEDFAVRCNPTVRQAEFAVNQAEISLRSARAGYLPTLSASAGHSRGTSNSNRHHGSTRNHGAYSGGLNFGITAYDFGRTSAAIDSAQAALSAAYAEYNAAKSEVIYNVRQNFFAVLRARDLHQVAVEAVQQYKEHLDQVKTKFEVGKGIQYDVTKAEVDYHNAQLNEITAANNILLGCAKLNQALGLAESPDFTLGQFKLREYEADADKLMEMARKAEPALIALRYRIAASNAKIDAAIAQLYPELSLSLSGSLSGHNPALPWLWNLSGALSMAANLFNAGENMRSIESAMLDLRQARSRYAAKEQSVYCNLRTAALNMLKARRQMEVSALSERSARENLDIVNEKFKIGKASSVDRTDAQVSYSTAKAHAVTAYFDYQDAQAQAAYLIGN